MKSQSLYGNDNGAIFSDCRKYRYVLWRLWDNDKPKIMFIGLNPSTANETTDDPTIRRVQRFSFDWGYGGVYMMNLFAWVTAYPEELKECIDPVGENDKWLKKIAGLCKEIVFAWGNFKEANKRSKEVIKMFPHAKCFQLNKNGTPKHPLYVKGNIQSIFFKNGIR